MTKTLNRYGEPVCPHCNTATNKDYAQHANLQCWNCGEMIWTEAESPRDKLGRLKSMIVPGQQTWDLSDNDVAAIRWVVERHEELLAACRAVVSPGCTGLLGDGESKFFRDNETSRAAIKAIHAAIAKTEAQ